MKPSKYRNERKQMDTKRWWAVVSYAGWGVVDVFPAVDESEAVTQWRRSSRATGELERLIEISIVEKKKRK